MWMFEHVFSRVQRSQWNELYNCLSSKLYYSLGAKWVNRWPTDLEVWVRFTLEVELAQMLHTAFHYHPIVLIWLRHCWKGRTLQLIHHSYIWIIIFNPFHLDIFLGGTNGLGHTLESNWDHRPGPEVIKLLSCSTQLSMKF